VESKERYVRTLPILNVSVGETTYKYANLGSWHCGGRHFAQQLNSLQVRAAACIPHLDSVVI